MLDIIFMFGLFASFLTKKYLLAVLGGSIVFNVFKKNILKYFICIWVLLNAWQFLAIQRIYLDTGWIFPEMETDIDFFRNALIGFSVFVSASFILLRLEKNTFLKPALPFVVLICLAVGVFGIWFTSGEWFSSLYETKIREGWINYGFDDLSSLVGCLVLSIFIAKKNLDYKLAYFLFGLAFVVGYFLDRRTTLIFCISSICYFVFMQQKKYLWFGLAFLVICLAVLLNIGNDNRLFNMVGQNLGSEPRLILYKNFFQHSDSIGLLGSKLNPSVVTDEGLTSFHSVFLDSAWYGGPLGLVGVFCGLGMLISWIYRLNAPDVWFFGGWVVAGMVVAAPPFSNLLAINFALAVLPMLRSES